MVGYKSTTEAWETALHPGILRSGILYRVLRALQLPQDYSPMRLTGTSGGERIGRVHVQGNQE